MAVAVEEIASGALSPPLKWAGGKRWLVPHLLETWAEHRDRRLVEPFAGGMAVTLGLLPRRALLGDVNPHLISFYRWLQRGLDLRAAGVSLKNDRAIYAHNRARFNELIREGEGETAEAAALFYYLNRTGYNGLCRFNARGFFNVPFGRYKHVECTKDFLPYRATLSGYEIVQGDFEAIDIRDDDFIYADPPYDVEFTSYAAGGFTWADQRRLAKRLAAHPGPVIASNQATDRILRLYKKLGFDVEILDAPRRISCDGNRDDAREMLATRNV
jgi:DNA adenine methylase